jgi:hypothetical protein
MKHLPKKQREKRMSEQSLDTIQRMLEASQVLLEYYEDEDSVLLDCPFCLASREPTCMDCAWRMFTGVQCESCYLFTSFNITNCRLSKDTWYIKERIPALKKWIKWLGEEWENENIRPYVRL